MRSKAANVFHRFPILDGLETLYAQQHRSIFPFHTHPTYNISLVLEQTFHTKLQSHTAFAPAGAIVITHPEEIHSTICDTQTGSRFFTFYIAPGVLSFLNRQQPVYFKQTVIIDPVLFDKFFRLSARLKENAATQEQELLQLLAELVRKYAGVAPVMAQPALLLAPQMEPDLFEKFSLEKIARKSGLDKYSYIRRFKKETGLTPNHYVTLRRIEKAKELLHTGADLLDIAIQTGFYDATHLCKYFRKITGVTPQAYHHA